MRIQSITEANTQQQQNPFLMKNADLMAADKSATQASFRDCLRSQILDFKAPAATRKAELVAVSSLWGYLTSKGVSPNPEQKPKTRAFVSLSET